MITRYRFLLVGFLTALASIFCIHRPKPPEKPKWLFVCQPKGFCIIGGSVLKKVGTSYHFYGHATPMVRKWISVDPENIPEGMIPGYFHSESSDGVRAVKALFDADGNVVATAV